MSEYLLFRVETQHYSHTRNFCGFGRKTISLPDTSVCSGNKLYPIRISQTVQNTFLERSFTLLCFVYCLVVQLVRGVDTIDSMLFACALKVCSKPFPRRINKSHYVEQMTFGEKILTSR